MLLITQLIYIKPGEEQAFHEFESQVIPLMAAHGGKIIHRIRPSADTFIEGEENKPYEIHIVSFDSEESFNNYAADPKRKAFLPLKERSVASILMFKGNKI